MIIKSFFKKIINIIVFTPIVLLSIENKTIESQPQILFEHEKLQNKQEKRELLLKFNTAVLYLEQEKYVHAIQLLKQSSKILKVPSYLNIGIAYYKLKSNNNAYLYLKKIYDFKELQYKDKYSYFSACYYLYKITNNKDYINEIIAEVVTFYADLVDEDAHAGYNKVQAKIAQQKKILFGG